MTDTNRIDLDDLDVSDDADDEPDASRGDWFWQGEGDPDAEPDEPDYDPAESGVSRQLEADAEPVDSPGTTDIDTGEDADSDAVADADADGDAVADADADGDADTDAAVSAEGDADADGAAESHAAVDDDRGAIPRVPRENDDSPVGVPSDAGGAGSGAGPSDAARRQSGGESTTGGSSGDSDAAPGTPEGRNAEVGTNEARKAVEAGEAEAKGPHGGGADDMTMAIAYNAMTQLSDPQLTVAKAREWADWIGIVGEVEAPVINQFQREHAVDADFFNGTGTGPAERLANIGETSMFYADRMVLVGTPADEWIAEEAGWEFIPFETAAEKADWERET
ncbi:MAG: hypothetical protein ABEH81_04420 [Halopenitus sp.]